MEPEHPAPPSHEQAERAVAEALTSFGQHAETAMQALRLIDAGTPAAARGALLALEALLAESLGLSVWFCHLRGEHERARTLVGIEVSMHRALVEALERASPAAAAKKTSGN